MPSQEDYLDKLLKGIDESVSMEGDSSVADALDLGDLSNLGDLSGIGDLSDIGVLSDLGDLPDIGVMPDLGDLPDIGEAPDMGDFFDLDDLPSLDDLPDIASLLGAVELPDAGEASGAVELPDIGEISSMAGLPEAEEALSEAELPEAEEAASVAELPEMEEAASEAELPEMEEVSSVSKLPDLGDILSVEEPDGGDVMPEAGELGGMSEEDVEQALQANRTEPQSEEAAPDISDEDLMNLLKEADNSELQDIHDMLQKSDNNEALDDILAENQENPGVGEAAAQNPEAEENPDGLSERQRKALEKKRLKEEKAAAKKAAKEAKKEAKKAEKLAKKAGKPQEELQDAVPVPEAQEQSALNEDGAAMEDALSVDMSAIDDLLEFSDDHGEADIADAADVAGGKKKGLFAKILDFLTEEDEDEEEEQKEKGTEDIPLSDENKNILAEMDKEEPGKKGKKGKKAKKPKKGKAGAEDAENEGEGDEEGGKKAKKAKKPPKEKKPREDVPKGPKKKLPVKQLMPIVLTCVTVLFVILLLVNLGGDFTVKRNARKAYYQEDYETCYQELYGRTLNESEQVMFGKSESILRIRLWMREYELFSGEGAEAEALDILIQSVKDYAQLYEYAVQWNAEGEVSAVYGQMLDILQNKYGLTEAQALEIAAEPDDVEYTKLVTAIAQGQGYHSDEASSGVVELPHMLPEEKQFPENNGGQ